MIDDGRGIRVFTRLAVAAEAGSYYSKPIEVAWSNAVSVTTEISELVGKPSFEGFIDGSNDGQHWVQLGQVLNSDKIGVSQGDVDDTAFYLLRLRCVVQGTRPDAGVLTSDLYLSRQ